MRSVTYVANNDVILLETGRQLFPAMIEAIDAVRHEILFETYIFAEDTVARGIEAALVRAAARGVKVRVLVDWFGTGGRACRRLGEVFAAAGVHYRIFNRWFRRGIARTHRKITVVDGTVAFVGGININDDMLCDYDPDKALPAPRWDFAVRVTGPPGGADPFRGPGPVDARRPPRPASPHGAVPGDAAPAADRGRGPMRAGFVVRDNLRNRRTIQRAYLQAIGQARKSVLLANPYFAPGRKFRDALAQAASRGVEVTLLIGVGEFHLQDAVARSFYPKLLAAGIEVVEYRKTQLHAKIAVVDDDWATVGSSNCDGLSLFLNQEANIVVRNASFARAVRTHIQKGIADGVPVLPQQFEGMGWVRRAAYEMAYLLYKLTMRIFAIGYA
ncbi:phosphatidylserine/phosphatidylglycerophosphate/cardiolipin synthase family protein [Massilia sp. Dwa41.01b]|uniref:phospholipase D-like domain-containing protein n=1 Tax=Massilia sp. Dwa41.01b TaxID=2709302 RepID=UPI001E51D874|nr:phospholipase D-like domain-containing protein [Massilia sp. Dwa41.01b]